MPGPYSDAYYAKSIRRVLTDSLQRIRKLLKSADLPTDGQQLISLREKTDKSEPKKIAFAALEALGFHEAADAIWTEFLKPIPRRDRDIRSLGEWVGIEFYKLGVAEAELRARVGRVPAQTGEASIVFEWAAIAYGKLLRKSSKKPTAGEIWSEMAKAKRPGVKFTNKKRVSCVTWPINKYGGRGRMDFRNFQNRLSDWKPGWNKDSRFRSSP